MDIQGKVVTLFIGAGGIAGILSGIVQNGWAAGGLALLIFYLTYRSVSKILRFQPSEFPPRKIATTGFFPHFITWLILWIAVYSQLLVGAFISLIVFLLVCVLGYLILLSKLQLPKAQPSGAQQNKPDQQPQ
ncbi:MAG: hypothetical protein ACK4GQ_00830 [Candidatus Hadarchaeales archaeon]